MRGSPLTFSTMRIIKFRAIRTGTKHFFHGESLLNDSLYKGEIGLSNSHQATFEMCKKETLGQFTGLLDKNGVEIYEGDIIVVEGLDTYSVVFDNLNLRFALQSKGLINHPLNDLSLFEVIGNIHQNPELLK